MTKQITQTISGITTIPSRLNDATPEIYAQNCDISLQEQAQAVNQLNTFADQANEVAVDVNAKAEAASSSASAAASSASAALQHKNDAESAIAVLSNAQIKDDEVSSTNVWSSEKVSSLGVFTYVDDGQAIGTVYRKNNPQNYGYAGSGAIDFSSSQSESDVNGATGLQSFCAGYKTIASGSYSTCFGIENEASGYGSFCAGNNNTANKDGATAIGRAAKATGYYSSAIGYTANASGLSSSAIGYAANAAGEYSAAMGLYASATGQKSTAFGSYTKAEGGGSVVFGVHGKVASPFMVGMAYGTSTISTSVDQNLTVAFDYQNGNGYFDGSADLGNADYAEYFESFSGQEILAGYFVGFEVGTSKIKPSNENVIGIVSAAPAVVGDSASLHWRGKYLRDEFDRYIWQDVEVEEVVGHEEIKNEDGTTEIREIKETKIMRDKVLSPEYDENTPYIPRSERPEWCPVGLLGKLWVYTDDATIKVGDRVSAGADGKAIKGADYWVLDIREGLVKVLFK